MLIEDSLSFLQGIRRGVPSIKYLIKIKSENETKKCFVRRQTTAPKKKKPRCQKGWEGLKNNPFRRPASENCWALGSIKDKED